MHNFWLELLVEGGVIFAVAFGVWYCSLLWRLKSISANSSSPILRYVGRSLFLGFLGFIFAAVGPSSVIYMLPMWMLVGVALAVICLDRVDKADCESGLRRELAPVGGSVA
jgi:teichuronic acid biosynthesis protein TuaE